jgi:hypothetical protein
MKALFSGLCVLLIAACSHSIEQPTHLSLRGYNQIGIVPALYNPALDFDPFFARGPLAGAAKGAAVGAASGIYIGDKATDGRDALGAVLIGILLMPVTVPVGAVTGLVAHTPGAEAQRFDELIDKALEQDAFQLQFAKKIAEHAIFFPTVQHAPLQNIGPKSRNSLSDYRELYANGFDVIIEAGVDEIAFEDGLKKDTLRLVILAKARIVNASNNESLITYELSYQSPERTIAAWLRSSGKPLAKAIADGLNVLASRVIYNSFGRGPA